MSSATMPKLALTENVPLSILQPYYDEVTSSIPAVSTFNPLCVYLTTSKTQLTPGTVAVRDAGADKGKGLFATSNFKREDEVFFERPLVCAVEMLYSISS
jgi:hypothetical protein